MVRPVSGCIAFFGLVMLIQGFVHNYGGLLATRFLLGVAEAGIFPGSFYLISYYYTREESLQRFTWFFSSATIASAFGSLIASGIANGMSGAQGLASWRWIFIIEGTITMFVGMLAFWLVSDFPADVKWLTEDERAFVIARTTKDRGFVDTVPITPKGVAMFFTDPKRVLGAFIYFGTLIPLYSFTYFAPTIIKQLGLSTVQTQLHTVPPFAASIVLSYLVAWISDKTKMRFPYLLGSGLLVIAGIAMLQTIHSGFSSQYAALFLVILGVFTAGPIIICWVTMNMRTHLERSVGTAWMIGFGNIGGLIATFTLPTQDAPYFHSGYAICQAGACLGVATATLYYVLCLRENSKLKRAGRTDFYQL